MNTGLDKLNEASLSVAQLREELSFKEQEMNEANRKAALVSEIILC